MSPKPITSDLYDTTIVQGHVNCQRLWKRVQPVATCNELLPIWDLHSNIQIFLDLGSQGCVLLRLDDMNEFYFHEDPTRPSRLDQPAQSWPNNKLNYRLDRGFEYVDNYGVILETEAYKWVYVIDPTTKSIRYCPCMFLFDLHSFGREYYKDWLTAQYSGPSDVNTVGAFIENDFLRQPSKGLFDDFNPSLKQRNA